MDGSLGGVKYRAPPCNSCPPTSTLRSSQIYHPSGRLTPAFIGDDAIEIHRTVIVMNKYDEDHGSEYSLEAYKGLATPPAPPFWLKLPQGGSPELIIKREAIK